MAPARVPAPVRPVPSVGRRLAALASAVARRPPEAQVVQRLAFRVRQRAWACTATVVVVDRRRVVLGLGLHVRWPLAGSRTALLCGLVPVASVLHLDHEMMELDHELEHVLLRLRLVCVMKRLDASDAVPGT